MIAAHPATKWQQVLPATKWRRFLTATKWRRFLAATKWRNDVAMGVSPWKCNPHRALSPEGTTGTFAQPTHAAPSGLYGVIRHSNHGFSPVATTCRPFGTNLFTSSRYVGVEDDGILIADKMAMLIAELAGQFAQSAKPEKSIQKNTKALGCELPVGGPK